MKRAKHYTLGQRVLVPGTPGAHSAVVRQGGIGTITRVHGFDNYGNYMLLVQIDGAEISEMYRTDELQPAPTV
jgi:hypothetical protein